VISTKRKIRNSVLLQISILDQIQKDSSAFGGFGWLFSSGSQVVENILLENLDDESLRVKIITEIEIFKGERSLSIEKSI